MVQSFLRDLFLVRFDSEKNENLNGSIIYFIRVRYISTSTVHVTVTCCHVMSVRYVSFRGNFCLSIHERGRFRSNFPLFNFLFPGSETTRRPASCRAAKTTSSPSTQTSRPKKKDTRRSWNEQNSPIDFEPLRKGRVVSTQSDCH